MSAYQGHPMQQLLACSLLLLTGALSVKEPPHPIVRTEFIFEKAPFPQCHASTIAETKRGLVTAWFGGTREKNPDVGIWLSRHVDGRWTAPVEIANGVIGEKRYPCWNPVLFQPAKGNLWLFYKVGPSPSSWWGMYAASEDHGKTWSPPQRLQDGIIGPVKNKPVALPDGTILCPTSDEHTGWQVRIERMTALAGKWETTRSLNDGRMMAAIQPSILVHKDRLQILCRSKHGVLVESWSEDGGKTWGELKKTELPNPNSGIDAVTLRDGRHLLIYNPTRIARSPLSLAVSKDGKTWNEVVKLESDPGEYSYPAIIQTGDGLVHLTYTWKRQRIKHVVVDPARIEER
jgi:predicted neuraminidase